MTENKGELSIGDSVQICANNSEFYGREGIVTSIIRNGKRLYSVLVDYKTIDVFYRTEIKRLKKNEN